MAKKQRKPVTAAEKAEVAAAKDEKGRWKKGNRLWEKYISNDFINGNPPPQWESPQAMLKDFLEYLEDADKEKWHTLEVRNESMSEGKGVSTSSPTIVKVPLQTPYTIESFCTFCATNRNTFDGYKTKPTFSGVVRDIIGFMTSQNLEAAMLGVFKENLVARYVGLAENTNNNHSGEVGFKNITGAELDESED